jgi:uncharacterized membrane protein
MFNAFEVILLFFIYTFIGWIWEVILSFFQYKKFINRGFLIGPCLPIYGFGGLIATVFFSKLDISDSFINVLVIFVCTTLICSVLEYFTSYIMEKLFNNRWWDYSDMKYNLNGRICLLCSLGFGAGCTVVIKLVNPFFRMIFDKIAMPYNVLWGLDFALIALIFLDTMISFKIIKNFKNISDSVVEDNTDKLTKLVKKTIFDNYNVLYKRLIESFPNMQIQNRLSLLRERILEEQKKLEKSTYKIDIRRRRIKEWEKEISSAKAKNITNTIINIFKKK